MNIFTQFHYIHHHIAIVLSDQGIRITKNYAICSQSDNRICYRGKWMREGE